MDKDYTERCKAGWLAVVESLEPVTDAMRAARLTEDAHKRRAENLDRARLRCLPAEAHRLIVTDRLTPTIEALEVTRAWVKTGRPFLVLGGHTGRGKTVACAWTLAEHGGMYVDGPELVRLASSWNQQDADRLRALEGARLVMFDELARDDELTRGEKTAVFRFLNERQGARQRTVIATNRHPQYLLQRYEAHTMHRIKQLGWQVWLTRDGDLRLATG